MKLGLAVLRGVVVAAGWLVVLAAAALLAVEESGWLTRALRDRIAAELGPLGEHLAIEKARLHWFEPGIELEGLTFDGEPDERGGWRRGRERLRLSSVHVRLDPELDRTRLVRGVTVRGGRVVLADPLLRGLQDLLGREGPPAAHRPPVAVHGLEVDLETPEGEEVPVGSVDLVLEADGSGAQTVRGRLWPTLDGAAVGPVAIGVNGARWEDGSLHLHAAARALALDSAGLASSSLRSRLPLEAFRGELTLDADARFDPAAAAPLQAELRLQLRDASLRGAHVPLEDVTLDLAAAFRPEPRDDLWTPRAWAATAHARGTWNRSPADVWAVAGRSAPPGRLVEAWGRVDALILDEETLRAVGMEGEDVRRHFEALAPRGVARAEVVGRLLAPAAPGAPGAPAAPPRVQAAVDLRYDGGAQVTFHGWRDPSGEPQGFPVPATDVHGLVTFVRDDALAQPERLAFVDLRADHGSGTVRAEGLLTTPVEGDRADLDFALEVPSLAVDARLAEGLAGTRATRWVWDTLGPSGGTVAARWRLRQRAALGGLTAHARLELDDVAMRWRELPVPLEDVSGELELRWAERASVLRGLFGPDGRPRGVRPFGIRWTVTSAAGRGPHVRVAGLEREEPLPPELSLDERPTERLHELRVDVDGMLLRGRDWDVLAQRFPDLGAAVADLRAQGSADAAYHGVRHAPGAPSRWSVEAVPEGAPAEVTVTPTWFQRQTRELRGRVLVSGAVPSGGGAPSTSTRFALFGAWPGEVVVAGAGAVGPDGALAAEVRGAGVDPASPTLQGVLLHSLRGGGGGGGLDLGGATVDGRLDFEALVAGAPGAAEPDATYRVFLRDNRIESGDLALEALHGVLVQRGEVLRSERLAATLAGTPLELRDVSFLPVADAGAFEDADPLLLRPGFLAGAEGWVLQAAVAASAVPLDRPHLAPFLPEEALAALFGPSGLAGRVDLDGARFVLVAEPNAARVALRGRAVARDVSFTAGLPVTIERAALDVESLVVEEERVRGWWRVSGLDARVAGRRLAGAHAILTYVDGRLTVDDLSGSFAGGTLRALGGGGADNAIAVDLGRPFGFRLALRTEDVRVDRLTGGLFDSSVEDLGRLDGWVRLRGRGGEVLALEGAGGVRLSDARLWSIPVMRELFSTLGSDATAVFDRMGASWQLEDGVLRLSDLRVRSPLLQLVGDGALDLDGSLHVDLEVRYSLLDKLGPVSRVVYWLNNSLWRVAIRGDLSRPKVVVRNALGELVRGFDDDPPRNLPLPGWSPLPRAF